MSPRLAALLTLALALPAAAQDAPPRRPVDGDIPPRPRRDAAAPAPPWVGAFAGPAARVELRPVEAGFEGTIEVGGESHPAKGTVQVAAGAVRLEGRFTSGAREYEFTATLEGDVIVLRSGGATHRLPREVLPPPDDGAPEVVTARPGEVYVFALEGGAEARWLVREVGVDAVQYDVQTWRDDGHGLRPVGDPTSEVLRLEPLPAGARGARRERVTVSEVPIECVVLEDEGATRWLAVSGDQVAFPGCVRAMQGGSVTLELARIERP